MADLRREMVDGLEVLSALPSADTGRPPVLLVHGAWHGAWCWADHFLPYLADRGHPAHALSLRGHAGSWGREQLNRFHLHHYADDVDAVLAWLDHPAVVVGHSMGGGVVQRLLARRARQPLLGAALLASMPPHGVMRVTAQVAREEPMVFARLNVRRDLGLLVATREQVRHRFLSEDVGQAVVDALAQRVQRESYLAFLHMLTWHRPTPGLTPMLVLGARDDTIFTPAEVHRTAVAFRTDPVMLDGLAHDVMLDDGWERAADVLVGWLETLARP